MRTCILESPSKQASKRIDWIDIAKGIGMICVISGHTIKNPVLRGTIFSFHMPLFFILAGYTFHHSNNAKIFGRKTYHSFVQLAVLGYILFFTRLLLAVPVLKESIDVEALPYALLYFSGNPLPGQKSQLIAGMVWFLLVLFVCRVLYDAIGFIHNNILNRFIIIGFFIWGVSLGIHGYWLPFSLDIGFACLIYFLVGEHIRLKGDIEEKSGKWLKESFALWALLLIAEAMLCRNFLELAARRYTFPPISISCSVAGSLFIICVSIQLQNERIARFLKYIGKNSIVLFCVHYMDRLWAIWNVVPDSLLGNVLSAIIRICIDVLITLVICYGRTIFVYKRRSPM